MFKVLSRNFKLSAMHLLITILSVFLFINSDSQISSFSSVSESGPNSSYVVFNGMIPIPVSSGDYLGEFRQQVIDYQTAVASAIGRDPILKQSISIVIQVPTTTDGIKPLSDSQQNKILSTIQSQFENTGAKIILAPVPGLQVGEAWARDSSAFQAKLSNGSSVLVYHEYPRIGGDIPDGTDDALHTGSLWVTGGAVIGGNVQVIYKNGTPWILGLGDNGASSDRFIVNNGVSGPKFSDITISDSVLMNSPDSYSVTKLNELLEFSTGVGKSIILPNILNPATGKVFGAQDIDMVLGGVDNNRMIALTYNSQVKSTMENAGYKVFDLPAIPKGAKIGEIKLDSATYTNSVILRNDNGTKGFTKDDVLVAIIPKYGISQDGLAKAAYEAAGYKVVQVSAEHIQSYQGNLHCVTSVYNGYLNGAVSSMSVTRDDGNIVNVSILDSGHVSVIASDLTSEINSGVKSNKVTNFDILPDGTYVMNQAEVDQNGSIIDGTGHVVASAKGNMIARIDGKTVKEIAVEAGLSPYYIKNEDGTYRQVGYTNNSNLLKTQGAGVIPEGSTITYPLAPPAKIDSVAFTETNQVPEGSAELTNTKTAPNGTITQSSLYANNGVKSQTISIVTKQTAKSGETQSFVTTYNFSNESDKSHYYNITKAWTDYLRGLSGKNEIALSPSQAAAATVSDNLPVNFHDDHYWSNWVSESIQFTKNSSNPPPTKPPELSETEWSWSLPSTASSSSDTGQTNYPYSCNSSQCVLLNSDGSVVTDSMGNTIYLPLESKNTEKGVRTPAGVKLVSGGKVAVPMPDGSVKILGPLLNAALNAADQNMQAMGLSVTELLTSYQLQTDGSVNNVKTKSELTVEFIGYGECADVDSKAIKVAADPGCTGSGVGAAACGLETGAVPINLPAPIRGLELGVPYPANRGIVSIAIPGS